MVLQAPGKDVNMDYDFGDRSKTKLGEGAFGVVRDWPGLDWLTCILPCNCHARCFGL